MREHFRIGLTIFLFLWFEIPSFYRFPSLAVSNVRFSFESEDICSKWNLCSQEGGLNFKRRTVQQASLRREQLQLQSITANVSDAFCRRRIETLTFSSQVTPFMDQGSENFNLERILTISQYIFFFFELNRTDFYEVLLICSLVNFLLSFPLILFAGNSDSTHFTR